MGCGSSSPKEVPPPPVVEEVVEEPPVVEEAPVILSERTTGYMNKQGDQYKTWKRRFFVLENGTLTWFDKETSAGSAVGASKLGEINLKGYKLSFFEASIVLLKNENARDLYLEINNPANLTAWYEALNKQIAQYGN